MLRRTTRVFALLGVLAAAALAGCDDGGNSGDEMTVRVLVDGAEKGELNPGDSLTLQVPSGAEVVMQSNVDSIWTATDAEGAMAVHRAEPRFHSATAWSLMGATASMNVANGAAAGEVVTVVFQVDQATFPAVPAKEGDMFFTQLVREYNGNQTIDSRQTVTDVAGDGSREETYENLYAGMYYLDNKTYFDAGDRKVKFYIEDAGLTCNYEPPYAKVSLPLFVGKSWSSDTYFDGCHGDGPAQSLTETRTVQAYERVSTPAGDFDTLRILGEGNFTIYDLGDRDGMQIETCWWSVTLGRFVKCEMAVTYLDEPDRVYRTNTVLTAFHR